MDLFGRILEIIAPPPREQQKVIFVEDDTDWECATAEPEARARASLLRSIADEFTDQAVKGAILERAREYDASHSSP